MSVRTEPRDLSAQLQSTLTIPGDQLLQAAGQQAQTGAMVESGAPNDNALAAASDFSNVSPDHPLKRTVVINIRSSLSDLCMRSSRATWSPPSAEVVTARDARPAVLLPPAGP